MNYSIKTYILHNVEVQQNGIIRNEKGYLIARLVDEIDFEGEHIAGVAHPIMTTFKLGDRVRKKKGSQWQGIIVGTYSTELTPEGYAVESEREKGSVQIYPVNALELVS